MYEELQGYSSIDRLMEERKEEVKDGLNNLPQYTDIVKAMAGGKEYSIGIFVEDTNSRYISFNKPTGEISHIEKCDDPATPDFALKAKEKTFLHVIKNAEDIRNRLETKDILGVFSYIKLTDIKPGRREDWFQFKTYLKVLLQILRPSG